MCVWPGWSERLPFQSSLQVSLGCSPPLMASESAASCPDLSASGASS